MRQNRFAVIVVLTLASAYASAWLLTEGLTAMFEGIGQSFDEGATSGGGGFLAGFGFEWGPGLCFGIAIGVVLGVFRGVPPVRCAAWVVGSMLAWRIVLEIAMSPASLSFSDGGADGGNDLAGAIRGLVIPGLIGAGLVTFARDLAAGRRVEGRRLGRLAAIGAAGGLAMWVVTNLLDDGGLLTLALMFALWQLPVALGMEADPAAVASVPEAVPAPPASWGGSPEPDPGSRQDPSGPS